MLAFSTTYLLPAILLNPAFILHLINTFVSHVVPPTPPVISQSPHPFVERIGPLPGSTPYWDMRTDDRLCWQYTAVMVVVQLVAFGRVQDNRVRRRTVRTENREEKERETARREHAEWVEEEERRVSARTEGLDGAQDVVEQWETVPNGNASGKTNGVVQIPNGKAEDQSRVVEIESLVETSEEMMA